jgi:hypothetical protein
VARRQSRIRLKNVGDNIAESTEVLIGRYLSRHFDLLVRKGVKFILEDRTGNFLLLAIEVLLLPMPYRIGDLIEEGLVDVSCLLLRALLTYSLVQLTSFRDAALESRQRLVCLSMFDHEHELFFRESSQLTEEPSPQLCLLLEQVSLCVLLRYECHKIIPYIKLVLL